jgi:hypothetical protein
MKIALIEITVDVSDHDGYCSGNTCELRRETIRFYVDDKKVIELIETNQLDDGYIPNKYERYLTSNLLHTNGSYYCEQDEDSVQAGLGVHDYKIVKVEYDTMDCSEYLLPKYIVHDSKHYQHI